MAISDLDITCTALKLIQWKDPYTGSPWCSTYSKVAEIFSVKAMEKIFIIKNSCVITMQNYLIWEMHILAACSLHYPPQSVDFKFLCPGVLTYTSKYLRILKLCTIFATKPYAICYPHAHIQDTASYPQKGCRKCTSAKKKRLSGCGEGVWSYVYALWQPISVLLVVLWAGTSPFLSFLKCEF